MLRFLAAATGAALVAALALPALADDYPACTTRAQDHCRVAEHMGRDHGPHHMARHHHPKPHHK